MFHVDIKNAAHLKDTEERFCLNPTAQQLKLVIAEENLPTPFRTKNWLRNSNRNLRSTLHNSHQIARPPRSCLNWLYANWLSFQSMKLSPHFWNSWKINFLHSSERESSLWSCCKNLFCIFSCCYNRRGKDIANFYIIYPWPEFQLLLYI